MARYHKHLRTHMNLPELLVHGTPGIVSDGTTFVHTHTHTHTHRLMVIALSVWSRPFGTTRLKMVQESLLFCFPTIRCYVKNFSKSEGEGETDSCTRTEKTGLSH